MTEPEKPLTESGIRRKLLARKGDQGRVVETLVGIGTLVAGLFLLISHKHWEPLVPIVIGAALIDRRTIIDVIRAWRKDKDLNAHNPGD